MKISRLERKQRGDLVRVSAIVSFEDCNQPDQEIYIETEKEFEHVSRNY